MNRYYQQGGEMEQLMQLFQAFADAVQDDEFSTAEEVMQMFQQLSPQEQQQFVQQAMQIVQQEQSEAPEQEQMELEEEPVMQYGGYVNDTGYLEGYETSNNPYNIIPSNRITMKGVDPKIKYIKGTDNLGNTQYMEHGGEYEFDGDFVLEEPVYAQTGDTYYEKLLRNPEVKELLTMRENKKAGYLGDIKRFQELEGKYGRDLTNSQKSYNRSLKKETPVSSKPIPKKVLETQEKELQRLISEEEIIKQNQIAKQVAEEQELQKLLKQEQDVLAKKQIQEQINAKRRNTILKNKELQRLQKAKETINTTPITKKVVEEVNKSLYGTPGDVKVTFENLPPKVEQSFNTTRTPLYTEKGIVPDKPISLNERLRQGKIDKGISTGSIKPVPKVNLSIGNIGEVALQKLSNGSTEVLNQLKKLKIQNPNIKIADLKKYVPKVNVTNALKGLGVIGTASTLYDVYDQFSNLGDPNYVLTDRGVISKEEYEAERNQKPVSLKDLFSIDEKEAKRRLNERIKSANNQNDRNALSLEEIKSGKNKNPYNLKTELDYKRIFGNNVSKDIPKTISANQDKPKTTLPSKKLNKEVAEQVATPYVLVPPPVPTEVPEELNYDFRVPLMDVGNYYIPQEEREVNINPNVFNRTNIGVGKRFFKQYGGATQTNFKSRFNPNADINIGAETEQQFYQPYIQKMRLFPKIAEPELDPINQYDTMPMGVNSRNYEAPNAQSRSMFEGKGSNQLLDLSNYASRFDEDNFGMTTNPISNQAVNRKSKFEEFMDKYGKKSDLEFNPNVNQVAPYYNLMKASEPLAGQYRANVDLKYAETPLLDPLPVIQQIQNQQRLATQNINTNSPTGQSYLSNLTAQTQQKTMEVLNDIQQKNQQIAAQNEQARINAYNQEMQLNIAANQQYLQNQMQAQAAKDLAMGEALSTIDQMQANKVKEKNYFNSLAATTPGLKKSTNLSNMITGTQGFDVDKDYQKLYYSLAAAKTPEEREAIFKASQEALKRSQDTAKAVTKQIGGSINQFLKRK